MRRCLCCRDALTERVQFSARSLERRTLRKSPEDAELLAASAKLALRAELIGKARSYLALRLHMNNLSISSSCCFHDGFTHCRMWVN